MGDLVLTLPPTGHAIGQMTQAPGSLVPDLVHWPGRGILVPTTLGLVTRDTYKTSEVPDMQET